MSTKGRVAAAVAVVLGAMAITNIEVVLEDGQRAHSLMCGDYTFFFPRAGIWVKSLGCDQPTLLYGFDTRTTVLPGKGTGA